VRRDTRALLRLPGDRFNGNDFGTSDGLTDRRLTYEWSVSKRRGKKGRPSRPFYYWRFVRASTGSMPRNRRLARRPVSRKVVDRTITRGRRPDVWLTLSGWLWLIYFVGVTTGAIRWLL
jgi:hypothetical protein